MNGYETTEYRLIEWIRASGGDAGIGDDCAVLPGQVLVTCDTLVEGTHFARHLTGFADLGWKAVAVNLSDIAAMGGRPRQIIVSLTLPDNFKFGDFRTLYASMLDCARAYRAGIVGGDLTRGPVLAITLTVIGDVHENGCLRRCGARAGDIVIVSGDFGASAGGLFVLTRGVSGFPRLRRAHLRPEPRVKEAWQLVEQVGSRGSLIDASDGLADALAQICRESNVGMEIDINSLPIESETRQAAAGAGVDPLDWALYGGEDYELVATVCPAHWTCLKGLPENPFKAIGYVLPAGEIVLKGAANPRLDLSKCFQHWSGGGGIKV